MVVVSSLVLYVLSQVYNLRAYSPQFAIYCELFLYELIAILLERLTLSPIKLNAYSPIKLNAHFVGIVVHVDSLLVGFAPSGVVALGGAFLLRFKYSMLRGMASIYKLMR